MGRWVTALALIAIPTNAQAMTVQELLSKVAALRAKGILARMSPDVGRLNGEVAAIHQD